MEIHHLVPHLILHRMRLGVCLAPSMTIAKERLLRDDGSADVLSPSDVKLMQHTWSNKSAGPSLSGAFDPSIESGWLAKVSYTR